MSDVGEHNQNQTGDAGPTQRKDNAFGNDDAYWQSNTCLAQWQ